jgi:thioredoxin reductase (NADPH)
MHKNSLYDVVIPGAGPAGLQADIHAARPKISVLVYGKQAKSSLFHAHTVSSSGWVPKGSWG